MFAAGAGCHSGLGVNLHPECGRRWPLVVGGKAVVTVQSLPTIRFRPVAALLLCLAAPCAQATDAPLAYQVQPGDTLIGIRDRLLVPGAGWRVLQQVNRVPQPRRLMPGQQLLIPAHLVQVQPLVAEALLVQGAVSVQRAGAASQPLASGDTLVAGDVLRTGPQASAVLRFVDGSRVLLRPDSQLRLERMQRLGHGPVVDTQLRLDAGSADSQVSRQAAPRFQIRTPVANLGVRGTEFRTHLADQTTTLEVLDGQVQAAALAAGGRGAQLTTAGFGTQITTSGVAVPRPLPPAPALAGLPSRIERLPLRLPWVLPAGADRARAQVFEAAPPGRLLLDGLFGAEGARWNDDLPDGDYRLQVRTVDAGGLEGRDASWPFTLKARPEPPFTVSPRAGEAIQAETIRFAWTSPAAAARYRLQVADSADFSAPRLDRDDITGTALQLPLPVGTHHWRMASIRASGDTGPWSDASVFSRVPPPPPPPQPPALQAPQLGTNGLLLAWRAEPGQRYQLQLAADAGFTQVLHDVQLDTPQWPLASPAPGRYHLRVRSVDADGRPGPYGAVQQVDVPPDRRWLWLLPAMLLLLL